MVHFMWFGWPKNKHFYLFFESIELYSSPIYVDKVFLGNKILCF